MDNDKRIVEIDGVKIEVDLRTAKVIDCYKVGDTVKILKKDWSGYKPYLGVIVDFDNFLTLPTITVAYIDGHEMKFVYINASKKSEDEHVQMLPYNPDEARLSQSEIVRKLNIQIEKAQEELRRALATKEIFLERFGTVFKLDERHIEAA